MSLNVSTLDSRHIRGGLNGEDQVRELGLKFTESLSAIIGFTSVGTHITLSTFAHLQDHLLRTHAAHGFHLKVEPFWNGAVIIRLVLSGRLLFLRIFTQRPLRTFIDLEPMGCMSELVVWVVFKCYRRTCRPLRMFFCNALECSPQPMVNERHTRGSRRTRTFFAVHFTRSSCPLRILQIKTGGWLGSPGDEKANEILSS